jgi:hypothetical protein
MGDRICAEIAKQLGAPARVIGRIAGMLTYQGKVHSTGCRMHKGQLVGKYSERDQKKIVENYKTYAVKTAQRGGNYGNIEEE